MSGPVCRQGAHDPPGNLAGSCELAECAGSWRRKGGGVAESVSGLSSRGGEWHVCLARRGALSLLHDTSVYVQYVVSGKVRGRFLLAVRVQKQPAFRNRN